MAQRGRYFDTLPYTEADYAYVQDRLLPEGIIRRGPSNELAVSVTGGMSVVVEPGEAMIQGFHYLNDAGAVLAIGTNSSGVTRTDYVVLQLNRSTNTIAVVVKPGAPALVRTPGGMWEMLLGSVAVPNGASAIVAGNITDQRASANCGFTRNGLGSLIQLSEANGTLLFGPAASQTPSATAKFHFVFTPSKPAMYLQSADGSPIYMRFGNNANEGSITKAGVVGMDFVGGNYMTGVVNGDMVLYTHGSSAGRVILGTAGVIRMILDAVGGVTIPGTLTVTGAAVMSATASAQSLNVNTTGAAAGEVKTSGAIKAGSHFYPSNQASVAFRGFAATVLGTGNAIIVGGVSTYGYLFVVNHTAQTACIAKLAGGAAAEGHSAVTTGFSFTSGGAGIRVYWDGASSYLVQSALGGSQTVSATFLGLP